MGLLIMFNGEWRHLRRLEADELGGMIFQTSVVPIQDARPHGFAATVYSSENRIDDTVIGGRGGNLVGTWSHPQSCTA